MTQHHYQLSEFEPAWWLPGPHAQTIGARFLRGDPGIRLFRERIELPDGDFVDLDHALFPQVGTSAPVVVVLHGLEGGSRSTYVLHALRELAHRGLQGVALNFRSCSGAMNRLPRFYHAGDTGDLHLVLRHLRSRSERVAAVGYSLGGNVLLKFLGEQGEAAKELLTAAVAISVPFDLDAGAAALERGMGRIYTRQFVKQLTVKAAGKAASGSGRLPIPPLGRVRTLREFDEAATAPLHGFKDASEYYQQSSAAGYVHGIRVRTLILQSLDDPFLPSSALPIAAMEDNPDLIAGITERGGHVGFVSGPPHAPVFWAEREAARFLESRLMTGEDEKRKSRAREIHG